MTPDEIRVQPWYPLSRQYRLDQLVARGHAVYCNGPAMTDDGLECDCGLSDTRCVSGPIQIEG